MEKLIKFLEDAMIKEELLKDEVAKVLLEEAKKTGAGSKEWRKLEEWVMTEGSEWLNKVWDNVEWGIVDESR